MLMRGGTSKGAYFLAEDLPADTAARDDLLLRVMGSPDPRQIDGLGGAHPLTSKVAVVSASDDPEADVDYLFLQVAVDRPEVTDRQNCGNILAGIGPFAVERGLVASADGETSVRIRMLNTGIRDTQELRDMGFAAWSRAVSSQGTVKATGGSVNVPIAIDGQVVRPGDVIVADDDGVVVVPREKARETAQKSEAREAKEAATRAAFLEGQLGLDRYGLRDTLKQLGVEYRTYEEYTGAGS